MSELQFRRATAVDVDDIVDIVNLCYRGDASKGGWTTEADLIEGTRTDRDEIAALVAQPNSVFLLCHANGDLVGSVHIQKQLSSCYLGMLVVKPGLQGAGTGARIIQAAEDYAQSVWHSSKMTMTVITVRSELIAYYERRGYRRTGRKKELKFDKTHGMPLVEGLELEFFEKDLDKARMQ